jgi:hypothetical protein
MQRLRSMKTLQKFSSVHAEVHNHFNQERHLVTRQQSRLENPAGHPPPGRCPENNPRGRGGRRRATRRSPAETAEVRIDDTDHGDDCAGRLDGVAKG